MKIYKLLKDLPLAKTGEEVEIYEKWKDLIRIYKKPNNNRSWILICQIEKENISEWLEEIPQKPKSIWDLKEWDDFYFIINSIIFENIVTDCVSFKDYLKEWNVFLTKKEAEAELEKRKAIQRVRKYCYENNIKLFSDEEIKEILEKNVGAHYSEVIIFYFIHYKMNFKKFDYSCLSLTRNQECLYFEKEKDIKKVIVNCETDLRIIFNV